MDEPEYYRVVVDPEQPWDFNSEIYPKLKKGYKIISAVSFKKEEEYDCGPRICYILARDDLGRLVYG